MSNYSVFGGIGLPSAVRSAARRSGALRNFGLKPRMPRRTKAAFIRLMMLFFQRRDRSHAAVLLLATQPAKKGTLEEPDIQPIGLRSPMLT